MLAPPCGVNNYGPNKNGSRHTFFSMHSAHRSSNYRVLLNPHLFSRYWALSQLGSRLDMSLVQFEKIQDGGRHLGKISNGHISATGRLIHFMFGYRVGFSGTADLMALFSIRRGHCYKLYLPSCKSCVRYNCFSQRVIRFWNVLPECVNFYRAMHFLSLIHI